MNKITIPLFVIVAVVAAAFSVLAIPDHKVAAWTCALSVDKTTIVSGESAKLSWTYSYPDKFVIDNGIGTITKNNSSVTVSPTVTTTYTGTVSDSKGTRTCGVTIIVTTPPPCNCSISATKKTITAGESTTISWDSENAVSAVMDNGVGSVAVSGSKKVSPTVTTTYTITFKDKNGKTKTCEVTIVVTPPPSDPMCTLDADKSVLEYGGGTVRLTWDSENTNSGSMDNGVGILEHHNGSKDVQVTKTTTFTATFIGDYNKKVTCKKTITVKPKTVDYTPSCTMSLSPETVVQGKGDSVTLTWDASNVDSGFIDNGIATVSPSGSRTFIPNQETLYTGTFTGKYGTAVCTARVKVTPPPCTVNCGGGGFDQPRVEMSKRDLPNESPLAFVYLSQVPYTGFPATPLETALYWLALVVISGVIAYYIIIKNVLWKFAAALLGASRNSNQSANQTHYVVTPEEQKEVMENAYAESRMSAAPMNLPGTSFEAPAAPRFVQTASSLKDAIENHAHSNQVLFSPEVVDALIAKGNAIESAVLNIVESVVESAKASFPREDGWILINRERLQTLVPTVVSEVVAPVTNHVREITEQFKAAITPAPAPVVAPVAQSYSVPMPKEINSANFMTAIAEGKEEDAYKMLRTLAAQGRVHAFMLEVIASLDSIYTNRIEGGKVVDAKIAEKTAVFSNNELESLLAIMISGIDYTYSSEQTASKLAVTKAIEFFKSKNK